MPYQPYDPTQNLGTMIQLIMAPAHARAQALRTAAEATARGVEASAGAWGNFAGGLGQIAQGVGKQITDYQAAAPQREAQGLELDKLRA